MSLICLQAVGPPFGEEASLSPAISNRRPWPYISFLLGSFAPFKVKGFREVLWGTNTWHRMIVNAFIHLGILISNTVCLHIYALNRRKRHQQRKSEEVRRQNYCTFIVKLSIFCIEIPIHQKLGTHRTGRNNLTERVFVDIRRYFVQLRNGRLHLKISLMKTHETLLPHCYKSIDGSPYNYPTGQSRKRLQNAVVWCHGKKTQNSTEWKKNTFPPVIEGHPVIRP